MRSPVNSTRTDPLSTHKSLKHLEEDIKVYLLSKPLTT